MTRSERATKADATGATDARLRHPRRRDTRTGATHGLRRGAAACRRLRSASGPGLAAERGRPGRLGLPEGLPAAGLAGAGHVLHPGRLHAGEVVARDCVGALRRRAGDLLRGNRRSDASGLRPRGDGRLACTSFR